MPFVYTLEDIGSLPFFATTVSIYTFGLGMPAGILLGVTGPPLMLAVACLATWSFTVVNLLCRALDLCLWAASLAISNRRVST